MFALSATSIEPRTSSPDTVDRVEATAERSAYSQTHPVGELGTDNTPQGARTQSAWPSLYDETRCMLEVAAFIYQFAKLRELSREGKTDMRDTKLTTENLSELIDADELYRTRLIRTPLSLYELVFDDSDSKRELVYGVSINHTAKRIVLVFRDLVTKMDFIADVKICQTKISNPVKGNKQSSRVGLHSGFKDYLFGDDGKSKRKCNKISKEVNNLLKEYPGYHLYITGHSLGADWRLSSPSILHHPNDEGPVMCIPFASPKVGDLSPFEALSLDSICSRREHGHCYGSPELDYLQTLCLLCPVPNVLPRWSPSQACKNHQSFVVGSLVRRRSLEITRNFLSHTFILWR